MTKTGQKIMALRKKGMTYRQIQKRLGVSTGNISYYCTKGGWGRKSRKVTGLNGLGKFWRKTEDLIEKAKHVQGLILEIHKALNG